VNSTKTCSGRGNPAEGTLYWHRDNVMGRLQRRLRVCNESEKPASKKSSVNLKVQSVNLSERSLSQQQHSGISHSIQISSKKKKSNCFSYCKSVLSITFGSNSHLTRIESPPPLQPRISHHLKLQQSPHLTKWAHLHLPRRLRSSLPFSRN
jgi:hypothetical protein